MSKHATAPRLPKVTKGHKFTGVTPVAKIDQHSQTSHLFWNEIGERKVFGPSRFQEAERLVCMVRENLRIAQSRQKSYANHRRIELSFEVGDYMYLKVAPMRGL
jgi:hypothetical protein